MQRIVLALMLFVLFGASAQAAGGPSPGAAIGTDKECMQCHSKQFAQWQARAHSNKQPVAGCIACHGTLHR